MLTFCIFDSKLNPRNDFSRLEQVTQSWLKFIQRESALGQVTGIPVKDQQKSPDDDVMNKRASFFLNRRWQGGGWEGDLPRPSTWHTGTQPIHTSTAYLSLVSISKQNLLSIDSVFLLTQYFRVKSKGPWWKRRINSLFEKVHKNFFCLWQYPQCHLEGTCPPVVAAGTTCSLTKNLCHFKR